MGRPPYCGDRLKGNDMTIDAIIVGGFLAMILVPLAYLGWYDCKSGRTGHVKAKTKAKTPSGSVRILGGCAHRDAPDAPVVTDDGPLEAANCQKCNDPMTWGHRVRLQHYGQDPNVCGMCQWGERLEMPSC